jgi:hypothetical protein
MMYDSDKTDIFILFMDFNQVHPQLQGALEPENANVINYIDLSIQG